MGLVEEEKRRPRGSRAPLPPSPNWTRRGGAAPPPLSFPPSLPSPQVLIQLGKGGSPTPGRSRTPPARLLLGLAAPPCSFIYGGRGAPLDTQVDLRDRSLSRVRCTPPP